MKFPILLLGLPTILKKFVTQVLSPVTLDSLGALFSQIDEGCQKFICVTLTNNFSCQYLHGNWTAGSMIKWIEYLHDFLINPNSLYIQSVSFFSCIFPENTSARSTPSYGNKVIRWISMLIIDIGSPSQRYRSCTNVRNFHIQMVFILVRLKCGTHGIFRSLAPPTPVTHYVGSKGITFDAP